MKKKLYEAPGRSIAFRANAMDIALLDAITRKTGIQAMSEVIRMGIRQLADTYGIEPENMGVGAPKAAKGKK